MLRHSTFSLLVDATDAFAKENHGATGTSEGLVRCGCHHVCVREGRGNDAAGNQAANVRHIHQKVRANFIGNLDAL